MRVCTWDLHKKQRIKNSLSSGKSSNTFFRAVLHWQIQFSSNMQLRQEHDYAIPGLIGESRYCNPLRWEPSRQCVRHCHGGDAVDRCRGRHLATKVREKHENQRVLNSEQCSTSNSILWAYYTRRTGFKTFIEVIVIGNTASIVLWVNI